jgi:hypothetical protein
MNKEIVRIVIDLIAFLALSDDDIVNPDSAIEQLEHVAATLKELSAADRQEFLSLLMAHARDAELSGDHERFEFLTNLPAQLGI